MDLEKLRKITIKRFYPGICYEPGRIAGIMVLLGGFIGFGLFKVGVIKALIIWTIIVALLAIFIEGFLWHGKIKVEISRKNLGLDVVLGDGRKVKIAEVLSPSFFPFGKKPMAIFPNEHRIIVLDAVKPFQSSSYKETLITKDFAIRKPTVEVSSEGIFIDYWIRKPVSSFYKNGVMSEKTMVDYYIGRAQLIVWQVLESFTSVELANEWHLCKLKITEALELKEERHDEVSLKKCGVHLRVRVGDFDWENARSAEQGR